MDEKKSVMMKRIKLWIKNCLWKYNYMIPLTTKYRMAGKKEFLKKALPRMAHTEAVRGKAKRRCVAGDTLELMERVEIQYDPLLRFYYHIDENKTITVKGNILGNFPLDYRRIIEGSFYELADRAIRAGGEYGENAKIIKRAVDRLYQRILVYLNEGGHTFALGVFEGMLERKAEHFAEGLQRVLFFNQILWQTRHRLNGIGRIDHYLGELYQADIEAGCLDKKEAYELIKAFLTCLNQSYEFKSAALMGDIGQIIVLGGLTEDGVYFYNDLTGLFMQAHRELAYPDPKILLRVSKSMPDSVIRDAVECLQGRTGSPIFSNDDIITDKLIDFGFLPEDAYAYCVSACWEPFIPGKSSDQNNIVGFDLAEVFFDLLESTDLSEITSFKELLKAYDRRLDRQLKIFVHSLDEYRWAEDPLLSMFTDSCTQNATDISRGGAVYNNYGFTTVGMASVCDSLLNIREYCFRQKKITLSELEKYRENDFQGCEDCYEELRAMRGHFGHDDKDSIALVNHIIHRCDRTVSGLRNCLGGRIKFGLSSPDYILAGKHSPADFAGRKCGMPYNTHISAEDAGYTELIGFAGDLAYGGCNINGNVVDFFVQPNILSDNKEKFEIFLKGAMRRGFYQLQMNIMDSATLIEARKYPERYKNLIVRVWGFSAYFNDLPEEYKERLIQRALKAEEAASYPV